MAGGTTSGNAGGGGSAGGTTATGAGTRVDVTLKISQLQNLCKRDPVGYREDYDVQVRRLQSECDVLKLSPQSGPSPRLIELIQFAAAVSSSSYKGEESDRIAKLLIDLLLGGDSTTTTTTDVMMVTAMPTSALQLHRDIRKSCVSALILMRNKGALEPLRLLELFFRLMAVVPDKGLRELLYKHMVNDIRNINKKGKRDDKVNRSIQSFLHKIVANYQHQSSSGGGSSANEEESATDIAAKRATDMVCELYRRQVWTDDRAVAILASSVQSRNTTVMARAMRFFLNIEEKMAEDNKANEDNEWDAAQKINLHKFSRKTKNRLNHVGRQLKNRQKQQRKREGADHDEWMEIRDDQGVEDAKKLYPAIELLRDPQGLAEYVLKRLKQPKSIPFRIKLLMMNFVTRLVGNHELLLLGLYPFLQKYMGGHQRDVTAVLAYCVQACHEDVPPDEVYGILKTIAHNFITDRCSEEQMAVGINAVRAIMSRVPSVLSLEDNASYYASSGTNNQDEKDGGGANGGGSGSNSGTIAAASFDVEAYVRDIAAYSNHRHRSVSIAGKGFLNFIRETYPTLLQGKTRGLKGAALHKNKTKPLRYGEKKVAGGVEGADLLVEYEAKKAAYLKSKQNKKEDENDEDEEEEVEMEMEPDSDDEAPDLVRLEKEDEGMEEEEEDDDAKEEGEEGKKDDDDQGEEGEDTLDLSKMTSEEREKLKQDVSSTRIFSAADFVKMRKLVAREERAKRDPREAARRKRAAARGEEFDGLSGDSDNSDSDVDSDEEDAIHIKGAVNPNQIMADSTRKRQSKAERLQKVVAGREKFESKQRAGGSTNAEKERKKNFLMSKSSKGARTKGRGKGGLSQKSGGSSTGGKKKQQIGHLAKKRRRR